MKRYLSGQRLANLFCAFVTPLRRGTFVFWMALYLTGLANWIAFFKTGDGSHFYHSGDWTEQYMYFSVIRESVETRTIPWHTSSPLQLSQPTDRFLAIPETLSLLAPQVQLLRWMGIKDFVLLDILLMYTIGTIGWYGLSRYYRFPPLVALIGFVLFAFNGHIVAHLAAGHFMWSSYYWLPWFILLVLRVCERPVTLRDACLMALVMGGIVLQGGCHLYIWCLFFLGLLFITNPLRYGMVAVGAFLSALLAAHRFIPAVLTFNTNVHRYHGFDSPHELWNALISRQFYTESLFPWEFDCYIGRVGTVCVLAFLVIPLLLPAGRRALRRYWPIAPPAAAFTLLTFSVVFYFVLQYIPILATQRVPSRLIIVPLMFAVAAACISATNLLNVSGRGTRVVSGIAGVFIAGHVLREIGLHAMSWRLATIETKNSFRFFIDKSSLPLIVSKYDPVYVTVVWVSLALSVVTLGAIVWWLWRTRRAVVGCL